MALSTLPYLPPELASTGQAVPVLVDADRTLRVKIIDSCGLACTFCHNEGTPVTADNKTRTPDAFTDAGRSGRVSIYLRTNGVDFVATAVPADERFSVMLRTMKVSLGITEVHFTGGEPSLHPRLVDLVALAATEGLQVGITSNGENFAGQAADCARAGLDRVNFSVFGTTPEELASVQGGRYANPKLAERKISALHESIEACIANGVKASANIVVPGPAHVARVERLLERHSPKLTVRLLKSLADGPASIEAIMTVIERADAEPICHRVTAASSNWRTDYRLPDGRMMSFKQLRALRLPRTCEGCRFNNDTDCEEGYYGVRVYRDTDAHWQVGVCLQRMDLCQSLDEFVRSAARAEILALRENEYRNLVTQYGS
jgi:molybdenum cofactor biosynthesis enzyme MoaA